ncbi:chemotaxis protein CheC [Tindallia magadiensis]|uniref:Chemotaxis protein CheC n=1 Tax=Tindallia magadiensis TaxID=69895 RepID=A0A1I3AI50_9FIRM|nr:chemotaxis protein CheC [Tindallia magadiensis]SFH49735.1 chemotaxis protein CheC [Tindallia magadiensis]
MNLSVNDLNSMHLDVLKEIGNIGAGNAATSLAVMIQKKVDMQVPVVKILDVQDVPMVLGGEENIVAGIYFGMTGEIEGNIMVLLDMPSARKLTNFMMGGLSETSCEDDLSQLNDMEKSALQEIGNILSGSYVSSLASLTNLRVELTTPSLCVDMAGAILSVPAIQFGTISDCVLMIENTLFDGHQEMKANFFLIPDENSFDVLLQSLGVSG